MCLKSGSNTYIFNTFAVPRPDITESYAYLKLNLDYAGYKTVIPLDKIADGIYEVGILIKKDDTEALQYTDMVIMKSKYHAEWPIWRSKLCKISLPEKIQPLWFHIDGIQEVVKDEEEYIEVWGWAFIDRQSPSSGQTYVVLRSGDVIHVFDTSIKYTPWVTSYFQNLGLNLDWAGFIARIPKSEIGDVTYDVGVYIGKNNTEALQYTDDAGNRHSLSVTHQR